MDLRELESYRLSDAVKFHDRLNPVIWGSNEQMLPEVRERLLAIAADFQEFLGIDVDVQDITISGSNAAYAYTPHSDIDLHLVVDLPLADSNEVYRELFDAKKYQYNDSNDFKIGGYDVELYVQDPNKPHHSQGIYSVKDDRWVQVPRRRRPDVDDVSVRSKYQDIGARIEQAIRTGDLDRMDAMAAKIKEMRAAGLEQQGEFGPENLAFKILRNNGTLEKLSKARKAARDQRMSLDERRKKKTKKKTRYGYGSYWFPGYHYYGQTDAAADGGSDGGGESVRENHGISQQDIINRFARSCTDFLGMENCPDIKLRQDPQWSKINRTFGRYCPDSKTIELSVAGRHIVDVLRTLAHEMTHARQDEVVGLPDDAGETGSTYEDQANALAGQIMRHWAQQEPEMFSGVNLDEDLRSRVGAMATAACIAGTPGCATTDALKTAQTVGRAAQNLPSGTAVKQELEQKLRDYLRQQRGEVVPEQAGNSRTWTNQEFDQLAATYAKKHRVPLSLVRHVMQKETGGLPAMQRVTAESSAGAIGIMQLMPATAAELGVDPRDPVQNIEGGVRYLRQQLDRFRNNHNLAMMAYNWGPGNVRQWQARGSDPRRMPRETRNYIAGYVGPAKSGQQVARAPATQPRREPAQSAQSAEQQQREQLRQQELARIEKILQRDLGSAAAPPRRREVFEKDHAVPEDFSPDDPPGPEFKPTMPQGTVRVDVSDMYDWYKLGQHISDLEGLGRHDFGKGPPSTILAFGDEDLEHKYIQDLKNTGLDVTDLDPAEHRPMKGQKTDPTYNVAEASGYIPTAKEKNDPRFSMALTVDVHPGETGRQANKLGLKTDSQGRPALLMKKLNNLLEAVKTDEDCWDGYRQQGMKKKSDKMVPNCVPVSEDEELTEVKMSPAEFQKFLKSPAAEGIRAGFEAELIFRDTQSDPDGGGESEPDYDADERAYSIDDIISFFTGGDGGIGPGTARRLQDQLTEAFSDWARESFYDNYFDQARFQEWADDNVWPEVEDEYRDQARDNLDDEEATDEDIEREAVTLFHDDVERDWDRSGDWYGRAEEELYDEYWGDLDQSDWLDQADLRYMSNVAEAYGLDWPYWTDGSGSGGTRDWQEIADSLGRVTGMPVRVSSGYHGAARRPGQYIIEPDSSLDSDDPDDYGLEVVSPPLPLPEAVEQLRRIIDWANGPGDAYTNSSTGLHMGVSLPYRGGDVDPVKLILFMGDKNLLELFGRESNTYARSAYERLESKIRSMKNAGPKQVAGIMELMKNNLIELAERDLRQNLIGDKYVSVNPHDGYIEFRGPGGDYLAKSDEIDGVLENTMLRLAYAMSIAGDNAAYRKEYAKKLYKVLTTGDRDNPFMRLFSDYSAGMLSGEELKARWADTVLAAERRDAEDDDVEDVPTGTAQEYEVYDRATGEVYTTFQARNDDEAVEQFSRHHRAPYARTGLPVLRVKAPGRKGKESTSRRAELAKRVTRSTRDVGEQLWRVNHHSSQRWVIARSQAEAVAKAVQQDRMFDSPETRARIATDLEKQQWQLDQERQQQRQRDSEQDAAQIRARLGAPQAAGGEFTGAWEIRDSQGRELHRFGGVGNTQADANRFAASWLGRNRPDLAGQEVDVVPVMR